MSRDTNLARLNNAVAALREHYDSVQIFVTRHDTDGTMACNAGRGNWYARSASVREWLLKCDERDREAIRRENDE